MRAQLGRVGRVRASRPARGRAASLDRLSSRPRSPPAPPSPGGRPQLLQPRGQRARAGADRVGKPGPAAGRAAPSPPSHAAGPPRWSARAGCRTPGRASGRSRGGGEEAGIDRVAAEDRAERERAAVARIRPLVERRRDQLRAAQRRHRATPGSRTACRASRRRGRARSSSSPAGRPRPGWSSPRARRAPARGRTRPRGALLGARGEPVDRRHLGARHRRRHRGDARRR